jgi:hypothetical protein
MPQEAFQVYLNRRFFGFWRPWEVTFQMPKLCRSQHCELERKRNKGTPTAGFISLLTGIKATTLT